MNRRNFIVRAIASGVALLGLQAFAPRAIAQGKNEASNPDGYTSKGAKCADRVLVYIHGQSNIGTGWMIPSVRDRDDVPFHLNKKAKRQGGARLRWNLLKNIEKLYFSAHRG